MEMLSAAVTALSGVGTRRAEQYARLDIYTLDDLLHFYPRTYEDWSQPLPIRQAPAGEPCCIAATVTQPPDAHVLRRNMTIFRLRVTDGSDYMTVTLFNAAYTARSIQKGQTYLLYGTVTRRGNAFEMSAPQLQPAEKGAAIHPVYPQTAGLSSRTIAAGVAQAIRRCDTVLETEWLPTAIRQQYALCTTRFAVQNVHFPQDGEALRIARRRLIFDELFLFRLGLLRLRSRSRAATGAIIRKDCTAAYLSLLPFTLTGAQRRAIADGIADMQKSCPMSRLIQGDVGSGKTAVAAGLAFTAAENGLQTALMAPTDILAHQHVASLRGLLGDRFPIVLLTGSLTAAEKRAALAAIADGSAAIVVGTHALLTDKVRFHRLGLVITDEQHRFGVAQRAALAAKGEHPHLLVMSATPIPRTLALLVYGDLDVSILDELPPGRQPISTYAVDTAKRERVYAFIRKHIAAGRQAYIVCPLVEENDNAGDLIAATAYYNKLKDGALRGIPTALLHGQMRGREKDAVMRAFAAGEIKVLISTVVIEVGVDVPNAVLMVIENAERFGLAQLHQLRGRVGRGKHASTCILISDAKGEEATRRLKTMCAVTDGFKIAEEDLKMRGPGDFFGSRQHGLPEMRIANLLTDMATLREAGEAACAVNAADPALTAPEHQGIAAAIARLFAGAGDTIAN